MLLNPDTITCANAEAPARQAVFIPQEFHLDYPAADFVCLYLIRTICYLFNSGCATRRGLEAESLESGLVGGISLQSERAVQAFLQAAIARHLLKGELC